MVLFEILFPLVIVGAVAYAVTKNIFFPTIIVFLAYLYFVFDGTIPKFTLFIPLVLLIFLAKFRYKVI